MIAVALPLHEFQNEFDQGRMPRAPQRGQLLRRLPQLLLRGFACLRLSEKFKDVGEDNSRSEEYQLTFVAMSFVIFSRSSLRGTNWSKTVSSAVAGWRPSSLLLLRGGISTRIASLRQVTTQDYVPCPNFIRQLTVKKTGDGNRHKIN